MQVNPTVILLRVINVTNLFMMRGYKRELDLMPGLVNVIMGFLLTNWSIPLPLDNSTMGLLTVFSLLYLMLFNPITLLLAILNWLVYSANISLMLMCMFTEAVWISSSWPSPLSCCSSAPICW